VNDSL